MDHHIMSQSVGGGLLRPATNLARMLRPILRHFDPKRRVALLLVAVLVIGLLVPLSGCILRLSRPGLTLILWDGPRWADETGNRYHWVERKIAEFEAAHPFVEVVLVPMEWANLRGMLDSAKNAGLLPDVAPFDLSPGGVSLEEVDAGLLEPVDSAVENVDDLSPQAREAYTYAGQLWGFPSSMTGHVLLLNLDLFAERGVEPPAGGKWTWQEFAETCRQLTFDRDGDRKTDVWGFGTYVLPGAYEVWPFLYAAGARPLSPDQTTYTFNSETAAAALQALADLALEEEVAHPTTGSASVRTVFDLFARSDKQQVAIEPWSAWAIDYLLTQEGTIKNFAVAEYPTFGDQPAGPLTVGGTGGFVVFRQEDSYRRSMAVALANHLTDTAAQYEMARGYHAFPARRSALDLDPFTGNVAYQRAAEIIFHAVSLPRHPDWPEIDRYIQRELQMALLGIKPAAEALSDAAELVGPLLVPPPE